MFGSEAVAKHVYNTLRIRTDVQAAIGNPVRMENMSAAPQSVTFPLCLHYAESAPYNQDPIRTGQPPSSQSIRYVVRFISQGTSDSVIRVAAKDAMEALVVESATATVTLIDGDAFNLDIGAAAEWPLTTVVENGVIYRQKGFFLSVDVFRA